MNDIQNQSIRAQAASSVAPQVQSPKDVAMQQNKVKAEAAKAVEESGKALPQEQMPEEAKSVEVKEAVSKLNEYVQKTQRDLDFQLDEDSGKTIIRVYDRQSETLVRQIPDEVALELAKKLNTEEPSLLFSAQV
jgi:flagellar protein FlaG